MPPKSLGKRHLMYTSWKYEITPRCLSERLLIAHCKGRGSVEHCVVSGWRRSAANRRQSSFPHRATSARRCSAAVPRCAAVVIRETHTTIPSVTTWSTYGEYRSDVASTDSSWWSADRAARRVRVGCPPAGWKPHPVAAGSAAVSSRTGRRSRTLNPCLLRRASQNGTVARSPRPKPPGAFGATRSRRDVRPGGTVWCQAIP